jgi:hypothetical protein
MKDFKNPINRKEFVNQYGETMVMVMSANATIWVQHNDCNEDFEKLTIFSLKFILNAEELIAITGFVKECENILEKMIKNLEYPI